MRTILMGLLGLGLAGQVGAATLSCSVTVADDQVVVLRERLGTRQAPVPVSRVEQHLQQLMAATVARMVVEAVQTETAAVLNTYVTGDPAQREAIRQALAPFVPEPPPPPPPGEPMPQ